MTTILTSTAATSSMRLAQLRRASHTLAFALGVALVGTPTASQAQVAGTPGSAQAPHVDTSANGTPVVNITAPTQAGVSHNQYEHFNVDPKGVVLNNSGNVSQSQLAGYIVGNTNLSLGQSARVIVNEVTSANPSNLRGYTEVAGNRAEVVIANPNGITCDGCGFINTTRGTLVTGTPVFGGDGSLAAFRVTRGTLAINGAGLNGAGIDRLDLIARTVVANAKVWANELNVITGANQVNYGDLATQAIQGDGTGTGISLDVAALGGMYANKIRLLGTEAGVGVRNAGELATQGGDFTITQAGRLELTGKTVSAARLTAQASSIGNSGSVAAGSDLDVRTTGALDNSGTLYATNNATLFTGALTNLGKLYAVGGALNITATDIANRAGGDIYAGKNVTVRGASLDNAASLEAGTSLDIVTTGRLANSGTLIASGPSRIESGDLRNTGALSLAGASTIVANALDNTGAVTSGGSMTVQARRIDNTGHWQSDADLALSADTLGNEGVLYARSRMSLTTHGQILNQGVLATGGNLHLKAGSLISSGTLGAGVLGDGSLGSTGILDAVVAGALASQGSTLAAGHLHLSGASLDLSSGRTRAGGDIALTATQGDIDASKGSVATAGTLAAHATGALKNTNGALQGGVLDLQASRLDNRQGSITQTGTTDLTLAVAGTLDNSGGRIASQSGQLTLRGGTIVNDDGAIEHAGDGTLTVNGTNGISNRRGRIVGNGALDLDSQGTVDSTGGTLSVARSATLDAASFLNDAGTLVASALTVTTGGALSNHGGTLQSGGALNLTAGSFANGSGQVKVLSADLARLAIAGALTNGVGGFIGGNGGLWLHAGAIDNAGQLYAGSTADVATTGRLDNRGAIQSMGAVRLAANGMLVNDNGRIESGSGDVHATLTINAGGLSNQGGRIANTGDGLTTVNAGGTIANTNGTLGGQGDVTLNSGAIDNLTGGRLVAARNLTLLMGALNNTGGNVYAGANLGWNNGGATLTNVNGQFGAGQQLALTLAWLNNAGGNASANGDASFNLAGGLSGAGRIIAGRNLDLWLPGDFVNGSAGTLKANHRFGLHLGGNFYNADGATMESVGGLTIEAGRIENGNGARINSADTVLKSRGDVVNRGRIEGDTLAIQGSRVDNTGTLIGDTITVRAWDLTNGADFGGVADNAAYQSALIAATQKINLFVGGTFLNRDALVFSMGDIFIAANEAAGRTIQITNHSGDIEADGSILLAANQITNQRRVFETQTYTLNAAEQLANRHTTDNIVRYRYDDPDPLHKPPYVDPSQVVDAAEIARVDRFCRGIDTDRHRCRGYPYGKGSPDTFKAVYIDTLTSIERLSRTSAEGRIAAGGNITLIGSVINDKSTIAAARNLLVNGSGGSLPEGDSRVGGEVIRNLAWNPTGIVSRQVEWWTGWERLTNKGGRHWVEDGFQKYGATVSDITFALGDNQRPHWITVDPGQGLVARMTAGSALEIHGSTIDNNLVDAAGQPISGIGLGGNQGGVHVIGAGSGRIGLSAEDIDLRYAGPRPGSQSVGTPEAPAGQIRVPNNGLFTTRPGSGSPYLVETDPRFASQAGFLGSDYLMNRLGFNGERTMKRLGDGFYEQRMVLEQITSLTGRRYLTDNTDAMAQYRALMDAGADVASSFQLSVGVALTAEQMSRLTQDIVWMVSQEVNGEKVLVPVVYLSAAHAQDVAQSGAILSGKTMLLDASGNLTNTGTIKAGQDATLKAGTLLNGGNIGAGGNLSVTAAQDILNGGTIKGGNVSLTAGNDILSGAGIGRVDLGGVQLGNTIAPLDASRLGLPQGGAISATGNLTANAGRDLTLDRVAVSAGGDLSLTAKRDLSATASAIKAGGDAQLVAGRDLSLNAIGQTSAVRQDGHNVETTTHTVTTIEAGGNAILGAGRDLVSEGAKIKAGDQIAVSAGHDVVLNAVTDVERHSDASREGRKIIDTRTMDESLKGTELSGTKGVIVSAGHDIDATAASITSDKGGVALAAKNDVNLNAGTETHTWAQDTRSKKSGLTSSTTRKTHDATEDKIGVGTLVSGDSVTVAAGHDITTQGAQIGATNDLVMAAGNNLTIGTAETTHSETHNTTVKKSGLMSGGGFSVMVGASKEQKGYQQTDSTPTGSVIGSTDGKVTLTAGNTVHITGSDVLSKESTTIVGKDVTIDAAVAETDSRQTYKKQTAGVTLGLTGGVVDAAQAAYGTAHRGSEVQDDRLKALYAAKTAYAVSDGMDAFKDAVASTGSADGGISLRIGIGASSASAETKTHEERSYGSKIHSQGDVTIAATGGDLNVIGSEINGKNVALAAANDLNLLSQEEAHSSKSTNRNGSGEIGFSIGSQTGIYVSASAGRGKAVGNGVTHAESTVTASDRLTIVSGNDTTIQGAQLRGDSVVGNIGGNLLIKSEQDTDDYASKQQQIGASVTFGYGGSFSYNQSKTNSHYTSVNEVSGIGAGDGGFQLAVSGNTHLAGGVISSAADSSKNYLSTGSLTWEDIKNEASYKSSSVGISGSFSSRDKNDDGAHNAYGQSGTSVSPQIGLGQKGHGSNTTDSSIANGTIVVRDGPVDLSGLKRDVTLDNTTLKPIFDEKKLAEQQEMAQVAGQVGFRAAGDIGEKFGLKEGSPEKIALHGIVAAGMASLGGGDVGNAVGASTANQLAINAMAEWLQQAGYQPGTPEFADLLKMGSSALGLIVGGETGSSVAGSATQNNWLLHKEVEAAEKAMAACKDQACRDNVIAATQALNDQRDMELLDWGRAVDRSVLDQGGMTRDDYNKAIASYWSNRGADKNDVVIGSFGPATESGYIARQFAAGFTDTAKGLPSKVSSSVSGAYDYLHDRGLGGALSDTGGKIGDAATAFKDWFTSPIPAQSLQRSLDQYAMTTPYQGGELTFDAATGAATAYLGGKAMTWIGGKWIAKADAAIADSSGSGFGPDLHGSESPKPTTPSSGAKVKEEVDALNRIGGNSNGPVLTEKEVGLILQKQSEKRFDDLAAQYNDHNLLPKDFELRLGDKVMKADPSVSVGAPVYTGASEADVVGFFKQLAGIENMPQGKLIPGKGTVYTYTIPSGPEAGAKVNLRDFSSSQGQTGAKWTIDIYHDGINKGNGVEVKFK